MQAAGAYQKKGQYAIPSFIPLIRTHGNATDGFMRWVVAMLLQHLRDRQPVSSLALQQIGGLQQSANQRPAAQKRGLKSALELHSQSIDHWQTCCLGGWLYRCVPAPSAVQDLDGLKQTSQRSCFGLCSQTL